MARHVRIATTDVVVNIELYVGKNINLTIYFVFQKSSLGLGTAGYPINFRDLLEEYKDQKGTNFLTK